MPRTFLLVCKAVSQLGSHPAAGLVDGDLGRQLVGESHDDRSSIDVMRDPGNWDRLLKAVEGYAGATQAQRVVVDNILAESSILGRPTRNLRGGDVDWSRSSVHDNIVMIVAFMNSTRPERHFQTDEVRVGANPAHTGESGGLASDVSGEINRQRSEAGAAFGRHGNDMEQAGKHFRTITGIVKTEPEVDSKGVGNPDGVLRSKRILANDAVELFTEDAKQSVENLSNGVKELGDKARSAFDHAMGKKK
jgi:hypothetical protein